MGAEEDSHELFLQRQRNGESWRRENMNVSFL